MILDIGEKVHIIEKRRFVEDVRRHFIGEVTRCADDSFRVRGYAWIFDKMRSTYTLQPELRDRVISFEGDLIINVVPQDVILKDIKYVRDPNIGLLVVDSKRTILEVEEFGPGQ